MATPLLFRVELLHRSGIARDNIVNDWSAVSTGLTLSAASIALEGAIGTFYDSVGAYIGDEITRTAPSWRFKMYDLTGHLDGSPHGSPAVFANHATPLPAMAGGQWPAECSCCISMTDNQYTTNMEHGGTETIPTSEAARDQGAGPTFVTNARPRGSHRGRIYLGPLSTSAGTTDSVSNIILNPTFVNVVKTAFNVALAACAAANVPICVWSRRLAELIAVNGGWIDNRVDTQRRRKALATVRTLL